MSAVPDGYYVAIMRGIKATVTTEVMRASHSWQRAEGGYARFNAFNTTRHEPGDSFYNSFGPHGEYHVRNYPTLDSGIKATVDTLLQDNFAPIVRLFRDGHNGLAICKAIDGSPWGTHGAETEYHAVYGSGHTPTYRAIGRGAHGSDVRQVQEALINHGFSCGPTGADGQFGRNTEIAVIAFQHSRHMDATGIVNSYVRRALGLPA